MSRIIKKKIIGKDEFLSEDIMYAACQFANFCKHFTVLMYRKILRIMKMFAIWQAT